MSGTKASRNSSKRTAGTTSEPKARTTSSAGRGADRSRSPSTKGRSGTSISDSRKKRSRSTKRSGKHSEELDPARPFDPQVWAKARVLAREFSLVLEPEPDLGYFGRTIEFPYVMADGPTIPKCAAEVLEATTLCIATMIESGERVPSPASKGLRDQQVNLRITAEERLRLDAAAAREGYRSLSDYVRAAALNRAG